MSQHQHLLSEIIAYPDDDRPRLIFADWLEETSDPRAEFIRLQCELAKRENWDADYDVLHKRSESLVGQQELAWKKEFNMSPTAFKRIHLYFHRGMIEQMTLTAKALSELSPEILKTIPITKVRITHVNEAKLNGVLESGILKHIRGLRITSSLSPPQIRSIFNACSSKLRWLDFSGDRGLYPEFATAIGEASFAKRLTALSMIGISIGPEFFIELANQGGLPKLELLEFGGGMAIARPHRFKDLNLDRVRRLRVGGKLRVVEVNELCHLPLNKLTRLNLQGTRPPAAGLKIMLEAGVMKKVVRASFKNCKLSKASLAMILSTRSPKCTHLDLTNNEHVDREFLDQIVSRKTFPKLQSINVSATNVPASFDQKIFSDLPFYVHT